MIVKIIKGDENIGTKAGERFTAEPYEIDPSTKVVLLNKISKKNKAFKKEMCCCEYRQNVIIEEVGRHTLDRERNVVKCSYKQFT